MTRSPDGSGWIYALFLGLLLWAPVPLGSNRPWSWALLEVGVLLLGVAWLVGFARGKFDAGRVLVGAWPAAACFAVWLAYVWLQLLPLPVELLRLVSPESARWHIAASVPDALSFAPLTLDRHGTLDAACKSTAYFVYFLLALVLFPALQRMRRAHERLAALLPMTVLCQGEASRDVLLERFRDDETSVLFASMAFWQGVDVPGRSLELVILESLPFAVPDDPLIAARSERAERDGGSGFREIQLPHAALLLKQGFGRLLRSEADRGVVAVLDARLLTRSYGAFLVGSLPTVPVLDRVDDVRAFLARPPG